MGSILFSVFVKRRLPNESAVLNVLLLFLLLLLMVHLLLFLLFTDMNRLFPPHYPYLVKY
jgi:hypothetical protein